MQRIDRMRQEANASSSHEFIVRYPTPALLLRFVAAGELRGADRGPEGTMRHTGRRTLEERLADPGDGLRRKVDRERIAAVRQEPGQPIRDDYLIGRDRRCDVVLNDYTISAQHACIHYLAKIRRWLIEDLESTNQTTINGEPLPDQQRVLLTSLDELQLGRMIFLYMEPADLYDYLCRPEAHLRPTGTS